MIIKLILPAWAIPDGFTVTKITGDKKYTIKRNVPIFGGERTIVPVQMDGMRCLVAEGVINLVPDSHELRVDLDIEDAQELLCKLESR